MPPENSKNIWFFPKQKKWKGVALVIHGLNLRPEKMRGLIDTINPIGIAALNLTLSGHCRDFNESCAKETGSTMYDLNSRCHEIWMDETKQAFQEVRKKAKQQHVPCVLVSYSLGALLGLELFSEKETPFQQMILLAPPLAIRRAAYLLNFFRRFPQWKLKSFAPRSYRVSPSTSVAAYLALFQSIANVQQTSSAINIPTRIFLDPRDELISANGVKQYIAARNLNNWKVFQVAKSRTFSTSKWIPHHLLIDEESLGKEEWHEMQGNILNHLSSLK
ncbi:MAG: alpha/beta hydrolase [SAR324 cluster bacterium]|nr:alpha/beta hydrolase [SAR324 cluster bacterium]